MSDMVAAAIHELRLQLGSLTAKLDDYALNQDTITLNFEHMLAAHIRATEARFAAGDEKLKEVLSQLERGHKDTHVKIDTPYCAQCAAQPAIDVDGQEAPAPSAPRAQQQDVDDAAVEEDVEAAAVEGSRCACSGNCGRPSCNRNKKRKQVPVCDGTVVEGLPGCCVCFSCKCELLDCARPRNCARGRSRFCHGHGGDASTGKKYYSNQYGMAHALSPSWPRELQLCARLSYVMRRLEPEDVRAWRDYCYQHRIGAVSGAPMKVY
jgi:hypothetical protein